MNCDSSVDTMTGYKLDDLGFGMSVLIGSRLFTSHFRLGSICEAFSLLFTEPRLFSYVVKWLRREANHSLPTFVEIKSRLTLPYVFMAEYSFR